MARLDEDLGERSFSFSQDDDKEARLLPDATHETQISNCPAYIRWTQRPLVQWMVLMSVSCLYAVFVYLYLPRRQSDLACGKQTSMWCRSLPINTTGWLLIRFNLAPLNEAINYEDIRISNAFAQQSKYRGPPTPDLERAWEDLWYFDATPFPHEKVALVNQSTVLSDGRHLLPMQDGTSDYAVEFGVFHQLHCLNRIRQYTWRDWYFRHPDVVRTPSSMFDSDVGARMHTDHCIEALRISLMCHGDTTPLFSYEDPSAPLGMRADFSPQRKCRRFQDLHTWMKKKSGKERIGHDFEPEEAAVM